MVKAEELRVGQVVAVRWLKCILHLKITLIYRSAPEAVLGWRVHKTDGHRIHPRHDYYAYAADILSIVQQPEEAAQ